MLQVSGVSPDFNLSDSISGEELCRITTSPLLISHLYISIFPPFVFQGAVNIKFKHKAAAQLNFAKTR